jgi:hypothetical protein
MSRSASKKPIRLLKVLILSSLSTLCLAQSGQPVRLLCQISRVFGMVNLQRRQIASLQLDKVERVRLCLDYRLATFSDEPAAESGEGIVSGALFTWREQRTMAAANAFQSVMETVRRDPVRLFGPSIRSGEWTPSLAISV